MRQDGRNHQQTTKVTTPSPPNVNGGQQAEPGPWEMLGVSEPPFLADDFAPQVDRAFLRKFVRGELPEPSADLAGRLVLLFPSWSEAHKEVLAEARAGHHA